MQTQVKQGDFTHLAKDYVHRPGYSLRVLRILASYVGGFRDGAVVADIGAGTGKLTENLAAIGMSGYAVEPNDSMRAEGIKLVGPDSRFVWSKGSAEATGLPNNCADWVLMASAFHWTDSQIALKEFHRILKPSGFLTVLWNPRDLMRSAFHRSIEERISEIAPWVERKSSGAAKYTAGIEETLLATGHFRDITFIEAPHEVEMSRDRYLGAWRSVNDIQAQAGADKFIEIMKMIEAAVADKAAVIVPYRTRAWTVQAI